jgi:DNA-binding FadR family transcriptional regulator
MINQSNPRFPMNNERNYSDLSEFMRYLAKENEDGTRLPSLASLSQQLGVSIASLREQLEVARMLGLVEVRPKTGIRRLPYTFKPAVLNSLSYASAVDPTYFFLAFSDFRNHIEAVYWGEAVRALIEEDHWHLQSLVQRAMEKLEGQPIQIPHYEHRELHLSIYRKLGNPFVTGVLEAYWEAYEAVGLDLYTDISYLKHVWDYHQAMVNAICAGEVERGYAALVEHTDLLYERTKTISQQKAG